MKSFQKIFKKHAGSMFSHETHFRVLSVKTLARTLCFYDIGHWSPVVNHEMSYGWYSEDVMPWRMKQFQLDFSEFSLQSGSV